MNWSGRSGNLTSSMLIREGNNANALMAMLSSCPQRPYFRGFDERLNGITDLKRPLMPSLEVDILGNKDSTDADSEQSLHTEKKRRLTVEQVRCLENCFNLENKLEADRKIELAQNLGLQPRQVAVWFQNRRARCKAKQLEQDYDLLKKEYEALMIEKQKFEAEVASLTDKLASKEATTKRVQEGFKCTQESESQQHMNSDPETSLEDENQDNLSSEYQLSSPSYEKDSDCSTKLTIPEYSPKSDGYNSEVVDLDSANPIDAALDGYQESAGMISNQHNIPDYSRETFTHIYPWVEAPYGTVYSNGAQTYEEIACNLEDGLFYDQDYRFCNNMLDDQAAFAAWWMYWP